jgi:glutamate/tyrosine decarboxylase-like PLP-dependent enzyme
MNRHPLFPSQIKELAFDDLLVNRHPLFPSQIEKLAFDDLLTRALSSAQATITEDSVAPTIDMALLREQLAAYDFDQPRSLGHTTAWVIDRMRTGIVQVSHPRYFGLFNPTPTFPAQCADRIVAMFNPQLATATSSPVPVAIEAHVIQAIARRLGFPAEAAGHFTTGGSEANFTAVILALTAACPAYAEDGVRAFAGAPVFYVSQDSHLAWLKIAHQAGLGRSAVRLVATDGQGRMDVTALQEMLHADRAQGCVPFMIAATAGTTNAGMIDPLKACADIAAAWKLWYHVDAAWGGGLIVSDALRTPLAGIETADSVTIDAHKWFATTMGCGMLITRWSSDLRAAFHVSATYMPSNAATDPYVTTVQWSRRFLGLRLFLALASAGWDGYAAHVEHALVMIGLLREQIILRGWTVVNNSSVGVLCFLPPSPCTARQVVASVVASGQAWVSVAVFEGREVIRACVTSGVTTAGDIAGLVVALTEATETL